MKKLNFIPCSGSCSDAFCAATNRKTKNFTGKSWQHGLSFWPEHCLSNMPNDAFNPKPIEVNIACVEIQFDQRGYSRAIKTAGNSTPPRGKKGSLELLKLQLFLFSLDMAGRDRSKWFSAGPLIFQFLKLKIPKGDGSIQLKVEKQNTIQIGESMLDPVQMKKEPIRDVFKQLWDANGERWIGPNYNVKIILDFRERARSLFAERPVIDYKAKLSWSNWAELMDGPRHTTMSNLSYGARESPKWHLLLMPKLPQLVGTTRNYAPNPRILWHNS